MSSALKDTPKKDCQEREVPQGESARRKVFEGIHKSERFSANNANKAFAGVKARKK